MKPILKWVGGKTQIIQQVLEKIPDEIDNYYEPFVGGASVLIAVLEKKTIKCKIIASDFNPLLIQLYKDIQTSPDKVIYYLQQLVNGIKSIPVDNGNKDPKTLEEAKTSKESLYYWIRKKFNENRDSENTAKTSAMFVFLNKTCFRGVFREGPNGFNVPYGNNKNPEIFNEQHIYELHTIFKRVEFRVSSFEDILSGIIDTETNSNDFVYLDPPYVPENTKSFVGYTKDGFNKHIELFHLIHELTEKSIKVLHSNSNTTLVNEQFTEPKYKTLVIPCKRRINSKNPESMTEEVIISNY